VVLASKAEGMPVWPVGLGRTILVGRV